MQASNPFFVFNKTLASSSGNGFLNFQISGESSIMADVHFHASVLVFLQQYIIFQKKLCMQTEWKIFSPLVYVGLLKLGKFTFRRKNVEKVSTMNIILIL